MNADIGDIHNPGDTTAGSRSARVAIVTGGAQGIGAAVATHLGAKGHAVALLDRDTDAAHRQAAALTCRGHRAVAVPLDVADEDDVQRAVAEVTRVLGAPTILVNNAGVLRDALLFKMSVAEWNTVMDVHLRGAFLMSRAVQASMVAAGWGRIVNLSSTSATGNRGQANYSAAKAGIQGFTKTLALELGRFGVTVNAVAPGFIESDMTRSTAAKLGVPYSELAGAAAAASAVRRVGTPEDVAHVVGFFVDEASGFVSGQVLYVAGGPHG